MKQYSVIFLIIILSYFNVNGQSKQTAPKAKPSKSETQVWISKNIASHPFISIEGDIKNEYTITFDEIRIIIKDKSTLDGKANFWTSKIAITDIDSIYWKEKQFNVWLTIVLKSGKEELVFHNENKIASDGKAELLLSKTFLENDLPNRMVKAFKRLIEIYKIESTSKNDTF